MNKRGGVYMAIVIAVFLYMVGVVAIDFIKDTVDTARVDNSCSSPTSDGNKLLCLVIDSAVPYFILILLSAAGGYLTDRFMV